MSKPSTKSAKLSLKLETIRRLDASSLTRAAGGVGGFYAGTTATETTNTTRRTTSK